MHLSPEKKQHVVIVDDHEIIQHGLGLRLARETDIEVVGYCSNSRQLLGMLASSPIDLVITDFVLGPSDIDGVHLIRLIKSRSPSTRVLVLTSQYTPATASLVLQAGAHGFLGKGQPLDGLVEAVRVVARGQIHLCRDMALRLAEFSGDSLRYRHPAGSTRNADAAPPANRFAGAMLSPREQEVLRCCLDGLSVAQIAGKFSRSSNTISTQKQAAFRKLGIGNDSELFRMRELLLRD
ncbi:response regulator transcription factor [Xanthomonas sp. 60]